MDAPRIVNMPESNVVNNEFNSVEDLNEEIQSTDGGDVSQLTSDQLTAEAVAVIIKGLMARTAAAINNENIDDALNEGVLLDAQANQITNLIRHELDLHPGLPEGEMRPELAQEIFDFSGRKLHWVPIRKNSSADVVRFLKTLGLRVDLVIGGFERAVMTKLSGGSLPQNPLPYWLALHASYMVNLPYGLYMLKSLLNPTLEGRYYVQDFAGSLLRTQLNTIVRVYPGMIINLDFLKCVKYVDIVFSNESVCSQSLDQWDMIFGLHVDVPVIINNYKYGHFSIGYFVMPTSGIEYYSSLGFRIMINI